MHEVVGIDKDENNNNVNALFLDIDFKSKGKNGLDFANDLRNIINYEITKTSFRCFLKIFS